MSPYDISWYKCGANDPLFVHDTQKLLGGWSQIMPRSDTMDTISLRDVVLVDTKSVSADGRVYLGSDLAGETVKLVVVDESAADKGEEDEN